MEQMSLFDNRGQFAPLATRLRPDSLEDFAGQEHLLGKGKILRQLIESEEYKNGKYLPNEVELSEQLNI